MLHECRGLHSGVSTPITGELGCGRARHERLWAQRCARSDAAHCTTLSHEVWQPGVYVHATRQSMICNTHDSRCILVKPKGARPRKRTKPNKKKNYISTHGILYTQHSLPQGRPRPSNTRNLVFLSYVPFQGPHPGRRKMHSTTIEHCLGLSFLQCGQLPYGLTPCWASHDTCKCRGV